MSEREIIIKSLEKAERRLRTNRLFGDLTFGLCIFLLFPLAFKILDLFSPFRGRTVAAVLTLWAVSLAGYSLWRILQRGTLEQTAAQVDRKASLYDELKTAYWFITHPFSSDWVDIQIRRASKRASELNMDRLYPRVVPATSYLAAGLLALLIGLNFVPLPSNHNWVYLQAAPAFSLTDAEQNFLAHAKQLLEKTDQINKTDLAARIEEIMKDLQQGKIDLSEAIQRLQEIEQLLRDQALDPSEINKALDEISKDFETAQELQELKEAAQALQDGNLAEAAQKMEKLSEELEDQAADASLKELSEKIQAQQLQAEAASELQKLKQSLQERNADSKQADELKQAEEELESNDAGIEPKDGEGAPSDAAQNGTPRRRGQIPSDTPGDNTPVEDPSTQNLNVQLEQEQLTGQYDQVVNAEEVERTSKQERSKLDYRNVPSELSAAQKDVLNQERIPWEYRRLIKNYFSAIQRPREGK